MVRDHNDKTRFAWFLMGPTRVHEGASSMELVQSYVSSRASFRSFALVLRNLMFHFV